MQIESVSFKNFKVLRDTTLPLSRMTLLIGPNGSGKSTAFEGLRFLQLAAHHGAIGAFTVPTNLTLGLPKATAEQVRIRVDWRPPAAGWSSELVASPSSGISHAGGPQADPAIDSKQFVETLRRMRP